jgi:acyl carrier protein
MVPATFVQLDSLPRTSSGKVDRKALPAPEGEVTDEQAFEEPQGEIERAVAHIWAGLLGVQRISRHDNFFELGGHSLLAMQTVHQVQEEIGLTLALDDLFACPTPMALAACLAEQQVAQTAAHAAPLLTSEFAPLEDSAGRVTAEDS